MRSDPGAEIERLQFEATQCVSQGRNDEGERLLIEALRIAEESLGPDHRKAADVLLALAELDEELERTDQAAAGYQRAVTIFEASLGPVSPLIADALCRLAQLELRRGRAASAETHFRRALAIREAALGPDSPFTAAAQRGLASAQKSQAPPDPAAHPPGPT